MESMCYPPGQTEQQQAFLSGWGLGGGGESSSERTLTEEAGMIAVKRLIYLLNFSLKNKVVMEVIGQNRFRTFLNTNQKPQRGIPYTLDQSRKINKRRGV